MENRFRKIIDHVTARPERKACALVCPDEAGLEALSEAEALGLVQGVLFTDRAEGLEAEREEGILYLASSPQEAAAMAVQAVRDGRCDMILKGGIDTRTLLKEVVNKSYGLAVGPLISHVALLDLPSYHKMIFLTDGGMVMYPDLADLKGILENVLAVARAMGVEKPKVACLAAVEKVHDQMPETVRAAALKAMGERGELGDCLVEGPISFDLAFSKEAARKKGYESPVAGDADIFLVPDFVSGNLLAKSLVYGGGAAFAGFLAGAGAPVILTSRSATVEEKIYSIACSAFLADREGKEGRL